MGAGENDLGSSMSEIKRLSKDIHSYMHALATRLDVGLPPGMVKVMKKKKLLSSREIVQSISITVGDKVFEIYIENDQLATTINIQVNNIVLRHNKYSVPEWFSRLGGELKSVAVYHKDAADLLSDFLM